jgi:hypothetical protein
MSRSVRFACLAAILGLTSAAGAAQAAACAAPAPPVGAEIKGPVLHVIDGETLCVARGFSPDQWVKVRLAPEGAARVSDRPPPRGALMAAAFGKDAVCRIEAVANGEAVARCTVGGLPVAGQVRQSGAMKAAANWR